MAQHRLKNFSLIPSGVQGRRKGCNSPTIHQSGQGNRNLKLYIFNSMSVKLLYATSCRGWPGRGVNHREERLRERKRTAFDIVVVRINLAWVGCANSCESSELQQEWKDKYDSFPHLVFIKTLTMHPAGKQRQHNFLPLLFLGYSPLRDQPVF
jgi:hypothetical protein